MGCCDYCLTGYLPYLCQSLVAQVSASQGKYDVDQDTDLVTDDGGVREEAKHVIFKAGQSKRIWNELYKVQFTG